MNGDEVAANHEAAFNNELLATFVSYPEREESYFNIFLFGIARRVDEEDKTSTTKKKILNLFTKSQIFP